MFTQNDISLESQWRSIILFGKNSTTYKFAFAKSLLELSEKSTNSIGLEELAIPFSKHIIEHLRENDKQGNSGSSTFLNGCRDYIKGSISETQLISLTERYGFVNVIDAFQNVNGRVVPKPFYEKDFQGQRRKVVLTDEILRLKDSRDFKSFMNETEARWKLVETAWNLTIPVSLLEVEYDDLKQEFFIERCLSKRINITSARDSLNGYQKGRCFYSFKHISLFQGDDFCHVDHFLPYVNNRFHENVNINGIWNLVLAHKGMNGSAEKGSKVPEIKYLERLHKRNEFFIESKHPLGETIVNQTGSTISARRDFLQYHWNLARSYSLQTWKPSEELPACF